MAANELTEGAKRPNEYGVDLSSVNFGRGGQDRLTRVVNDVLTYTTRPKRVDNALLNASERPELIAGLMRKLGKQQHLSRSELAISSRSISLSMAGAWQYGLQPLDNTDTLFEEDGLPDDLRYPKHVVPANNLDALVLSGTAGLVILGAADDDKLGARLNRILHPAGFTQLQQMQILGALAFRYQPIDESFAQVPVEDRGTERSGHYMVGNDMTGDFAIQQVLFAGRSGEEVRDPTGEKTRVIKPVVSNEFVTATYHDFVPIIRGMLDHLRFELPAEVDRIRDALVTSIQSLEGIRGNFGNFGDVSAIQIGETKAMQAFRREYKDGGVIESGLSSANGYNDQHYLLTHHLGGVELQQASTVKDKDKLTMAVNKSIRISNSEIPYLVEAMIRQQSSRASDEYIAWTIATILSNQEQ